MWPALRPSLDGAILNGDASLSAARLARLEVFPSWESFLARYEPVPGLMLHSQWRCNNSSSSSARARAGVAGRELASDDQTVVKFIIAIRRNLACDDTHSRPLLTTTAYR